MLQNTLVKSIEILQRAKDEGQLIDFALIGGFAVSAWGYPRATLDIDFALRIDRTKIKELAGFLGGKARIGDIRDPLVATISFEIESGPVQLVVFPNNWENLAFEDIQLTEFEGKELPIVGWKQMVLLKLYAGSEVDLFDAKRIMDVQNPGQRGLESLRNRAKKLRVSKKFDRALKMNR